MLKKIAMMVCTITAIIFVDGFLMTFATKPIYLYIAMGLFKAIPYVCMIYLAWIIVPYILTFIDYIKTRRQ